MPVVSLPLEIVRLIVAEMIPRAHVSMPTDIPHERDGLPNAMLVKQAAIRQLEKLLLLDHRWSQAAFEKMWDNRDIGIETDKKARSLLNSCPDRVLRFLGFLTIRFHSHAPTVNEAFLSAILTRCTRLRSLKLFIDRPILQAIPSAPRLKHCNFLHITGTLTGATSVKFLSSILVRTPYLCGLELTFTRPFGLHGLKKINLAELKDCRIGGIVGIQLDKTFTRHTLESLLQINIHGTSIVNPASLKQMKNLSHLRLAESLEQRESRQGLTQLEWLSEMPALRFLDTHLWAGMRLPLAHQLALLPVTLEGASLGMQTAEWFSLDFRALEDAIRDKQLEMLNLFCYQRDLKTVFKLHTVSLLQNLMLFYKRTRVEVYFHLQDISPFSNPNREMRWRPWGQDYDQVESCSLQEYSHDLEMPDEVAEISHDMFANYESPNEGSSR